MTEKCCAESCCDGKDCKPCKGCSCCCCCECYTENEGEKCNCAQDSCGDKK